MRIVICAEPQNFQFFPRSHGVTPRIREIIECFKAVDKEKDASVHLNSND